MVVKVFQINKDGHTWHKDRHDKKWVWLLCDVIINKGKYPYRTSSDELRLWR